MKRRWWRAGAQAVILLTLVLSLSQASYGFAILSHQAIIDATWDKSIKPLLLKRYPNATAEQLREAHAYAYGGSIIQDMGYYPFSSKFFSDLTHYVRSGDFVEALLAEAQDINEYAFALGALSHYAADNNGHPAGTNQVVPLIYPELKAKYGPDVTYEENPSAHLKTEFSFDVLQVARGNYAPEAYHDFIGFKVSKPVLERAFLKTYGLEIDDIFTSFDLAIGTYRRTVSVIIPEMTRVAWEMKKDELEKRTPGITRDKFIFALTREAYDKEWGQEYEKPGFFAKTFALFFRVLPKVGPLKPLAFKAPTPEAERIFLKSFEQILDQYNGFLAEARGGRLALSNRNNDTGKVVRAGDYRKADETYEKLLEKLAGRDFDKLTPELQANILAYYRDLSAPIATKKDKGDWRKTLRALDRLKATSANGTPAARQ
ncbi:MAG TPA: zinc dependent phospholipase C family protein [Blastocatellia bacterium]|nr:zinc dependent phospholipase C family protein [Blastocatellia bacterium]